ncbi:MAG: glycosyltransferase family 39 protein, partial [Promethearchaeota archaeon]
MHKTIPKKIWLSFFILNLIIFISLRVTVGIQEYSPADMNPIFIISFLLFGIFISIVFPKINYKKTKNKMIILFLSSIIFLFLSYNIEQVIWSDAQTYYDKAIKLANEFPNINFSEISRPIIIIFSLFIKFFGPQKRTMVITEFFFASLIPIANYYLMRSFFGKRESLAISFFMITIPAFIINSKQPLLDSFLCLFNILTIFYYFKSLKHNYKSSILAGVFFCLSLFTKATALLLLPFFLI